ncbi:MAG: T9SS type A sorting domain-containing protein [Flavobacteriales bacterium]
MTKLLRTVNLASASLKTLALAIVLVLCGANEAFAQPSISCPNDVRVNCVDDMSNPDLVGSVAIFNAEGYTVAIATEDTWINSNGNPCRRNYDRTYIVTFTSEEGEEIVLTCSQMIRVFDFAAPSFIDAPASVSYQCPEEVPAYTNISAEDGCGGDVLVQQFGSSTSADDTLVCNQISNPNGPGQDWGVWIHGLYPSLASTDWYRWVGAPSLVFSNTGEARLIGDVVAMNNPANGWHVDMTMAEGENWAQWSAGGGSYMDNLGINGASHTSWNFYKLVTTISRLEGFGAFEGDQLILSHQPSNYYYGFQFGSGANNRNSQNGGSGWFFYSGHVGESDVNGHGDMTLQMGCVSPNNPNEACAQVIERRWSATDACNNVSYYTQTITVEDTTPPTFTNCPENVYVSCPADVPAPIDAANIFATDNCTGDVNVSYFGSQTATQNACSDTITHTYLAEDVCGNRALCSYSIVVNDDVAPVLSVPASYTVECSEDVVVESASAVDNCTGSLSILESVDTVNQGCVVIYQRNFSVSDDCGNISVATQTITVSDTTPPVLEVPAGYTVECSAEVVYTDASAYDNCSENLNIVVDAITETDGNDCSYTITRYFSVTDDCGNTATGTQVINVVDTESPSFENLSGPYYVECSAIYDAQWTNPAANDNCDSELTYSYSDELTSGGCLGTIHRTVTVSDNCGNSTSQEFVIYIQDTTAPVFTSVPADASVDCSSVPAAPSVESVVAVDNCGDASAIYGGYTEGSNANVTITFEQQTIEGDCPGNYTILWIWTATDYCENSSTHTTTISVMDEVAPVFVNSPESITIDCGQSLPGVELVSAVDNCEGEVTIAIGSDIYIGGSCAGQYLIERQYTATDACGNSSSYVVDIFVEDTHAPVFGENNTTSFTYECSDVIDVTTPSVEDDCSGVELSYSDDVTGDNCTQTIARVWTATDGCANQSTLVQYITVLDTQEPVIDFAAEIERPCDDYMGIYATANDNCDTSVEVVSILDEFVGNTCAGQIIRTYSATDDCGNTTEVQQIISLTDTTAPVAINQPQDITVECGDAIPSFDPSWADNCASELSTEVSSTSDFDGCTTIVVETYSVTDPCGNAASVSRVVTIVDTTNPVIVGIPGDLTISCTDEVPAQGDVEAYDNCDDDLQIGVADVIVPGNCAGNYLIERTYRVIDNCGNESVETQNIFVVDTAAPVFGENNQSDFSYECSESIPVITPDATDNCSQFGLVYSDSEPTGDICETTYTRTWTATDECGNQSQFNQTITISDTEAPVISGTVNIERPCNDYLGIYVTALDNCSEDVNITYVGPEELLSGSCAGEIVRTYIATDACGNSSQFIQVIQLVDETAPVCSNVPEAITVECGQEAPAYFPSWSDQCDVELDITSSTSEENDGCTTIITTTYTATDDCGNVGSVVRVVTVVDTTAPEASNVPADQSIDCADYNNGATVGSPTFTDVCDGDLTVTSNVSEEVNGCNRTYTYTWTATDNCNNSTTVTAVISVYDDSAPVFTSIPEGGAFTCDGGINFGEATAADDCSEASVTSADDYIPGSCPQEYTIVRTWIATDACGNMAYATSVYTVSDESAPVFISFPVDATLECDNDELPLSEATAADNCGEAFIYYSDELVSDNGCTQIIERTYTASDACGNVTTQVQTFYIQDTTAPVVSGDATYSISCDEFSADGIYIEATDNCGDEVSITIMYDEPSGEGCGNSVIRHYAIYDECQNTAYFNQSIVVTDTQAPVASVDPQDITISCSTLWSAPVVEFLDNCDSDLAITESVTSQGDACSMVYTYIWTATDDCGNTTVVDQYVTVVDEEAPVFNMESSSVDVECGTEVSYPSPSAIDNCSGEVEVNATTEITPGNCASNYTEVVTYTASDVCGNTSVITFTVNHQDTTAPVWSEDNAGSFTYECGTVAEVVQPSASDCSAFEYNYSDGEMVSEGCTGSFVRTWIAVDACGNANYFTQTISFEDTTVPELVGCPEDLSLACDAEVPAPADVTVSDNCDNDVTVTMTETCVGCPEEGSMSYNLYTPVRPISNQCNYPYDWAIALFSLPSVYRWYQIDPTVPAQVTYNGSTITLSGRVFNVMYPDGGFDFNVTYANGQDWNTWFNDNPPSGFKADCGGVDANYAQWMYYIMQAGNAQLTGWGSLAGSSLNLNHAPSNQYFGFQVGEGANNYNADYGAGGWFNYSGVFLYQGQPVSSGLAGGIGDFAFRIDNCPSYTITRSWTAIDCSGNESSCTQTINFSFENNSLEGMNMLSDGNEAPRDEEINIVGIQPNPANNHSSISFMSTVDGNLTLEVLDMTGRVVGSLFNRSAEAGVVYTAEFDADHLSTGIYMVRLSSGTSFQIERLQIQK